MKHIQTFESFLYEAAEQIFLNEANKNIIQLAIELVKIAMPYVEVDMKPEMKMAKSIDNEDDLIEFYDELIDTVAEDAGEEGVGFKKEAIAFLKKNGITIS